jgi:hypothetical protein
LKESVRQVEFRQQRRESRVVMQAFQEGVDFDSGQIVIALNVSPVQPLERFV